MAVAAIKPRDENPPPHCILHVLKLEMHKIWFYEESGSNVWSK